MASKDRSSAQQADLHIGGTSVLAGLQELLSFKHPWISYFSSPSLLLLLSLSSIVCVSLTLPVTAEVLVPSAQGLSRTHLVTLWPTADGVWDNHEGYAWAWGVKMWPFVLSPDKDFGIPNTVSQDRWTRKKKSGRSPQNRCTCMDMGPPLRGQGLLLTSFFPL